MTQAASPHPVAAVPAAPFAFTRHIDSFTDAVTCAVQLGGDTDTIAAMTGALAGALHGATAIPTPWVRRRPDLPARPADGATLTSPTCRRC